MAESALYEKFRGDNWKLLCDTNPVLVGTKRKLRFLPVVGQGQECISPHKVWELAGVLGADLGQIDAEWICDNQDMLSECPDDVLFILFPGTEWEHPNGAHLWPYLYRKDKRSRWDVYAFWLTVYFTKDYNLVRLEPGGPG